MRPSQAIYRGALKELWQQRQNNQLALSTYQSLGGINGTLDKRATEIYNSFDKIEQKTVQHIFQQLTQLGEGTEDTRRRIFQIDLVAESQHPAERVQRVIDRLSNPQNRLLITSEVVSKADKSARMAIVDVAHEALIRHWRLLRRWIEQNRDLLRQQRKIEASAIAWREKLRKRGYLIQGHQLADAEQFLKMYATQFPLSDVALAFIRESIRWQRLNQCKWVALLILPAVVVDYSSHRFQIGEYYTDLNSDKSLERRAVLLLTDGCSSRRGRYTGYFRERVQGEYCRKMDRRNLRGADLSSANLRFANLREANLDDADLRDATLSSADLREATLNAANLSSATLSCDAPRFTALSCTDLRFAGLREANLSSADLRFANLSSADLSSADLSSADLRSANLSSADLPFADLRFANLRSADLPSADLRFANLRSADLPSVDLRSANLRSANLHSANLRSADLRFADLSSTDLRSADLRNAITLSTDFRTAQALTQQQLEGDNQPFICNSPLPEGIEIKGGQDRDCDKLAKVLQQRYPKEFETLEKAETYVNERRQKSWE